MHNGDHYRVSVYVKYTYISHSRLFHFPGISRFLFFSAMTAIMNTEKRYCIYKHSELAAMTNHGKRKNRECHGLNDQLILATFFFYVAAAVCEIIRVVTDGFTSRSPSLPKAPDRSKAPPLKPPLPKAGEFRVNVISRKNMRHSTSPCIGESGL